MNYNKKTVYDVDVKGKKVLLRCDFNVPQNKETGEITSDKRIVAAIPTIQYLLDQGAAVIACSHLGKPVATFDSYVKKQVEKGKKAEDVTRESWEKSLRKLTLAPVAKRLSELLGREVIFAADTIGPDAQAKAAALQPGQIMLLENLRFEKGETKNDPALAEKLASMAEIYVSDAFGTVHRAHASTAGVAAFLPAVSGLLVAKELSVMGKALDDPKRPFVAVLGGAARALLALGAREDLGAGGGARAGGDLLVFLRLLLRLVEAGVGQGRRADLHPFLHRIGDGSVACLRILQPRIHYGIQLIDLSVDTSCYVSHDLLQIFRGIETQSIPFDPAVLLVKNTVLAVDHYLGHILVLRKRIQYPQLSPGHKIGALDKLIQFLPSKLPGFVFSKDSFNYDRLRIIVILHHGLPCILQDCFFQVFRNHSCL